MKHSPRRRGGLAVAAVVLFALAGCGGSPTAQPDTGGPAGSGATGRSGGLEKVLAAVKGLTGEQRRAKLVELAKAEDKTSGKPFNQYTTMNLDNSQPIAAAFEQKYGIKQKLYRATGTTVVQRVTQETKAKYQNGADVVSMNGTEIAMLERAGILAPLEVGVADDLTEVHPTWVSNYLNVFVTAWNTQQVKTPPKTWEEVLGNYQGKLSIEVGDFDWFATLVQEYLIKQKGMTEQAAVDLVRKAANGAYGVDGHTVQNELLGSGEFGLAPSAYLHNALQRIDEGAPIAWDKPAPVQPLIVRSNGIGINAATDRPATALLFVEFMVDDAQAQIASFHRTPANRKAPGGIPSQYKTVRVDLKELLDNEKKWKSLYEDATRDATLKGK
jgi:iron(III) transport system substrate-binding protein